MRVFQWRRNIAEYIENDKFEPFYKDFWLLAKFSCKEFDPESFGHSHWEDSAVTDIAHDILESEMSRGLKDRLIAKLRIYTDGQWNTFFKNRIRWFLLGRLRKPRADQVDLSEATLTVKSETDLLDLQEVAKELLALFTDRQKKVFKAWAQGKTLAEMSAEIGEGAESTMDNEKRRIVRVIRNAKINYAPELLITALLNLLKS